MHKEDRKMIMNGISGVNAQAGQVGMNQATDSYSRNLQKQIADAQKQLQELSSNEEITPEEKMKKRQEIQQRINDLNLQLRQYQMEQRREKQAKGPSMDDLTGGTGRAGRAKAGGKGTGFSRAGMTAMISAGQSLQQAEVQGSVAASMEGRAGVLESEIKNNHGADVKKKQEEFADVRQKAQTAEASQIDRLSDANRAAKEAAEADSGTEKEERTGKTGKTDKTGKKTPDGKRKTTEGDAPGTGRTELQAGGPSPEDTPADKGKAVRQAYTPVDIRL